MMSSSSSSQTAVVVVSLGEEDQQQQQPAGGGGNIPMNELLHRYHQSNNSSMNMNNNNNNNNNNRGDDHHNDDDDVAGDNNNNVTTTTTTTVAQAQEMKPSSSYVVFKVLVSGYSFFCAGVNDGTLGPLIPYIISSYDVSTGKIAIIYATTFAGWLLAAATNPILTAHLKLGQILLLGAALQLIAQALRPWSGLPFGLFCLTFLIQAMGMAYQDAHANAFVGGLQSHAHRWLSFIHACYAAGLLVGPLVATALANSGSSSSISGGTLAGRRGEAVSEPWKQAYLVILGISGVNITGVCAAFRDTIRKGHARSRGEAQMASTGGEAECNDIQQQPPGSQEMRGKSKAALVEFKGLLSLRGLWLISLFYFFYLGAMMTAGGWVVEFLTTERGGNLAAMGYVPMGFYGGLFAGRLLLAEPTFRLGERRMLIVYSVVGVGLQLVFWLQPNVVGSAVALSLMGFFFGPFFATGMSVASKVLPAQGQAASLSFIFVMAQAGAAIFPSITGVVATHASVAVLQPIVLALIVVAASCWWLVPKIPSRTE